MSVAELQRTIAKLPADQQQTVAKFVRRLKKSTSPARQRQLARSMREMDAGIKFTREEVMKARAAFSKSAPVMFSYRCVFTREAHDFICRASDAEMRELDEWLDRVERQPGLPGDYIERGQAGRELQVVCTQRLAVSYWVDHAVREVRIIRIEPNI